MFRALFYAYILGGLTFIPLLILLVVFITVYTSVPIGEPDMAKKQRGRLEASSISVEEDEKAASGEQDSSSLNTNDLPTTRRGWLTMRRTFEESEGDTSYVTLVRSFLDARSKDPKRSRPKDMWYVVLKRNILYLYEDEEMTECEAAIELSGHDVLIYPEHLPDGELYAKRNAICLRRKNTDSSSLSSLTREMKLQSEGGEDKEEQGDSPGRKKEKGGDSSDEGEKKEAAKEEAFNPATPWFIFVRSNVEMEDWYFSLLHASTNPAQTPTLLPLRDVFDPRDMDHLVATLDDQPDVIPMRWLNALIGRIFFSHYRTHNLEAYIIGRLMKKLEKVKRPQFLSEIAVTEVSVGNRPPTLSKPMLKELTKEGDAALEVHFQYKGEIRLTVEATAVINLGSRFKSYTVKLVLAAILKELEGNLLVKVKRPPSNRIWYAFTQTPRMVLAVEPIVSDRQITWGMILSTIESKIKEIFQESVVMPNMDDIAFFDSLSYENRGGIWADASRHSHPVPFPTPPEMADDAQSTASAPVLDLSTPQSPPPVIQTSHSDHILGAKSSSSSQSTEVPSKSSDEDSTTDYTRTRKKSWFTKNDDVNSGNSLSVPDLLARLDNSVKSLQGKGDGDDGKSDDDKGGKRGRSRPTSISSVKTNPDQASSLSEHGSRPQSRVGQVEKDEMETEQGNSENSRPTTKSPPTSPRRASIGSQKARSPSPPSFFSTLKSKAGDKQALSNTAKEAMRKWGVNWGLKKESNAGGSGSDDAHEVVATSSARLNPGTGNGHAHKARGSYAEVRAAVAERKERERNEESDRPVSPQRKSKRSLSIGKLSDLESPTFSNTSLPPENAINPSLLSAAARLSTSTSPRLNPKKSSPSVSRVNTDIDAEELAVPEAPIHVQPQAKTMSIPGIHASHRGEIMSLGYVAPSPPPPPSTTLESKLKNPAIQTVYRFWKSPSGSSSSTPANQDHDGDPAQVDNSSHSSQEGKGGDDNGEEPSAHLAPLGVVRPSPPPLPPRSIRTVVEKEEGEGTSSPSASSMLQDIVSKHEAASAVLEGRGGVTSPDDQGDTTGPTEEHVPDKLAEGGSTLGLDLRGKGTEPHNVLGQATPPPLPPRRVPAVV